jgi:hypothetical protein
MRSAMPTLGIIRDWPDQVAAEHETIERFKQSASILDIDLHEVDNTGRTKDGLTPDFILSLHFESGKTWRQPSIHMLWNPIEFLASRGFANSILNTCSHTFMASGGSDFNDNRINEYRGLLRNPILSTILPTLDGPILPPRDIKNRRIFYAGINWERIKGESRYNTLLSLLDATGDLDLFGPKEMYGVQVWKGFKSYRGELPFDGSTLINTAAESGIYLCLSSPGHLDHDLLSNRIFEASASGCLIIANFHHRAHQIFGDSILWLTSESESEMFTEVIKHVNWANQNPKVAKVLAGKSQSIFKHSLLLSRQLEKTLTEATIANNSYLAEFSRFSKLLQSGETDIKHKNWIPVARQNRELIPYAIGKILLSLSKIDSSIDVITAPWIAKSPDDATVLLPHDVQFCPFCKLGIRNANSLVRDRKTLYSQNIESHAQAYASEPFLYHECRNWLDRKGNLVDYDSDLIKIGLMIRASHSLFSIRQKIANADTQSGLQQIKKSKRFLKISKGSALYKLFSRWTKNLKDDSRIRVLLIWCYLSFFAIPDEL